jgi:hypothetical protein
LQQENTQLKAQIDEKEADPNPVEIVDWKAFFGSSDEEEELA